MPNCCPTVELRQYTLHPGKRETLIELFDRVFIESQEALGAKIIGQFRDVMEPNRFVWLRGFSGMRSRAIALREFYDGSVWRRNREAANATMADSDNVLLLRPARPASGFNLDGIVRAPVGAANPTNEPIFATIEYFDDTVSAEFIASFEQSFIHTPTDTDAHILAYFVTESAKNDYPALPVREGENVFVCFSTREIGKIDARQSSRPTEVLKLEPTARSLLRGR
jgi:hypothetical protein